MKGPVLLIMRALICGNIMEPRGLNQRHDVAMWGGIVIPIILHGTT